MTKILAVILRHPVDSCGHDAACVIHSNPEVHHFSINYQLVNVWKRCLILTQRWEWLAPESSHPQDSCYWATASMPCLIGSNRSGLYCYPYSILTAWMNIESLTTDTDQTAYLLVCFNAFFTGQRCFSLIL